MGVFGKAEGVVRSASFDTVLESIYKGSDDVVADEVCAAVEAELLTAFLGGEVGS